MQEAIIYINHVFTGWGIKEKYRPKLKGNA
jgi:hypothetical protein